MSIAVTLILLFAGVFADAVTPAMLIWGWIRWAHRSRLRTLPSILSLSGFGLATGSALLAVASVAYAHFHRFGFYDPSLTRVFRWGTLLSLTALLFAIGGVWRNSPVRWHALVCALGTLSFWMLAAEGND
jgi:hypothetical protein